MPSEDKRFSRGHQTLMALRQSLEELIVDRPLSSVTIDEICAHCGLTKGAFYHHFSSKDELLSQYAVSDMSIHMAEAIGQANQKYPDSPSAQIRCWIRALTEYVCSRRTNFMGYLFIDYSGEVISEFVADWYVAAHDRLTLWQDAGLLRCDLPASALHQYLDTFTYGIAALCMSGYYPIPPNARLIEDFISTLLPDAGAQK